MRIIDITHPPKDLWVGRESENRFRPVSFECANWFEAYPNATIVAYYQPYAASDPYPLVLTADGTKRIWHPTATELVKGNGELQIVLVLGDVVGTSAIIPTRVDRSLISSADHPADEAPSWTVQVVEDVTAQADRAEAAAESIGEHPIEVTETDPTVPAWAKQPTKPTYTAAEVGALPDSTVIPDISGKVDKVEGKGLSTNDFTSADKAKLDGIESGAQKNTVTSVNGMTGDVVISVGGAVDSVNGKTGVVVLNASDVGALPADTPIPSAVTEQTVSGWGFTKNTGDYTKPSGGIPKSDLASDVQTSLGKADTALQQHQSLAGYATESYVQTQIAAIPDELPTVTASDNGKFLRVVSGAWAAVEIPSAESASFGGVS